MASAALPAGMVAFAPAAYAQSAEREWSIARQDLGAALRAFSLASGVDIAFDPGAVRGLRSSELRGRHSVHEALRILLGGTGLVAAPTASGGYGVLAAGEAEAGSAEDRDIVVTGSRLARRASQGAIPVQTFTAEDIERSGRGTITEFLQNQPAVSVNSLENSRQLLLNNTQTTIRLRGLPIGTTLTLIDGRRAASSGAANSGLYFDLNTIPAAAIERVDLLLGGASPIYGSDAIAGVLNVNLRRNISGLHIDSRYGFADGTSEYTASAATGVEFAGGSISVIGTYFRRSRLGGDERALTRDADYRRFGGSDLRIESCAPGNIYSADGQNLQGLGASFAAIPGNLAGTPQIGDFAATQGSLNRCSNSAEYDIAPATQRISGLVLGQLDLSEGTVLKADLMVTNVQQRRADLLPRVTRFLVPATNPYNPFGSDVLISRSFPGSGRDGEASFFMDSTFIRGALALRSRLFEGWVGDASIVYSRQEDDVSFPRSQINATALQTALSSTDPLTAFNPFQSDLAGQRETLDRFLDDYEQEFSSYSMTAQAYVSGRLFRLPGGDLSVAIGGEHIVDSVSRGGTFIGEDRKLSRNVDALFAEARAPLISGEDSAGSYERLAISLSGRADWYSDVGRTINPQAGLEIRPIRNLLLRANYAEGFRAPTLFQQGGPATQFSATVNDPRRSERYVVSAQTGGNPDLNPETSSSFEIGAVYNSREGFRPRLELSYWNISYRDPIQRLFSQALVDNEGLFPELITRAAPTPADQARGVPGLITSIRDVNVNFGRIKVAGIDASVSARLPLAGGELEPSIAVTRITEFRVALRPATPAEDRLSRASVDGVFAPKLKATFGAVWSDSQRLFSTGLTARYIGRYTDYDRISPLGDDLYLDFSIRLDPTAILPAIPPNRFQLSAGAVNLLDRDPQFSNYPFGGGYDPNQADLRGRFIYLGFGVKL